jgi:iron transport multicopper oxidase
MILSDRYDVVPDDLVLNNTLQIVYDSDLPLAEPATYDMPEMIDDTDLVPVTEKAMIDHDIEFVLNAFFDVGDGRPSCKITNTDSTDIR